MTYFIFILACLPFILHFLFYKKFKSVKGNEKENFSETSLFFLSILIDSFGILTLIVSIGSYVESKSDYDKMNNEEKELQYIISSYDASKDNDCYILTNLLKDVKVHNDKIKSHRNNYKNFFIGCMYSEEVANMEYITLDSLKLK